MAIIEQNGAQGKICTVCAVWKPLDRFHNHKQAVGDGYFNQCKACQRARKRAKYAENPEPHRERARLWKQANPEATEQARERWREKNLAVYREHTRAQRLVDPAATQQKNRDYYAQNRERLLMKQRQRRAQHPLIYREHARQRRVRLSNTPGAHTEAEWLALKAHYGFRCLRCGRCEPEIALTRDHVIPLGEPGSSDSIANIQPLCAACNATKGRRSLDLRERREGYGKPYRTENRRIAPPQQLHDRDRVAVCSCCNNRVACGRP